MSPVARPPRRPLSRQFVFTIGVVLTLTLSILFLFMFTAMTRVDQQALSRQHGFVSRALEAEIAQIPLDQESVTIWDDAVLQVEADNQPFMVESFGQWMGTYYGFDRAYVLDPADNAVHAMIDSVTVDVSAYATENQLAPIVRRLRGRMAEVSAAGSDSSAIGELGEIAFVRLKGVPAIASVKPIVPSTDAILQKPGSEFLHVVVQAVDEDFVRVIAEQYALEGAHVAPAAHRPKPLSSVPLTDESEELFGYIEWEGYRPGLHVITELSPGLAGSIIIGVGLVVWLTQRVLRSSTELQVSEAQAQFLAFHDTLTGLPNRALFEDRLERALLGMRRSRTKVALHYIDLDRFKHVNDTLGHAAGDELVRQVATRIRSLVRETDTVARLGGDEFAVVQTEIANDKAAEDLASRTLAALSEEFDLGGERAHISASVGIVLSTGPDSLASELMRKADIALYEAKSRGRSRFQIFIGDMDDLVRRRRSIEADLRAALSTGTQLWVAYQPLYSADGKTILGAEALVRWDHPVHGAMSPDVFVSIAEERGLIDALGDFVLRTACTMTAASVLPWIAVNVSPLQFRNDRFAEKVFSALADTGLSPERLQLEITEGVLLDNSERVGKVLADLRSSGIKVALDDFGTGYSSMSYLRRYGIDKLKIDRSFIQQLGTSSDADAIVRAMVTLARSMRIAVTAEGVETEDQRDHLAAIGCHEFQGFLLSRPVPAEDLTQLLERQGDVTERRRA
jgi:diguanylate cyclase (GGDEF)-like protein